MATEKLADDPTFVSIVAYIVHCARQKGHDPQTVERSINEAFALIQEVTKNDPDLEFALLMKTDEGYEPVGFSEGCLMEPEDVDIMILGYS